VIVRRVASQETSHLVGRVELRCTFFHHLSKLKHDLLHGAPVWVALEDRRTLTEKNAPHFDSRTQIATGIPGSRYLWPLFEDCATGFVWPRLLQWSLRNLQRPVDCCGTHSALFTATHHYASSASSFGVLQSACIFKPLLTESVCVLCL
jgi:hypothetical protein